MNDYHLGRSRKVTFVSFMEQALDRSREFRKDWRLRCRDLLRRHSANFSPVRHIVGPS
jgi:hypothetical protein